MMLDGLLIKVLYRNVRRLFRRRFLSPHPPVHWSLETGLDRMTDYYAVLCRRLLDVLPPGAVSGGRVCEIGPGGGLAFADMMCGLGARHVDLYEPRQHLLTAMDVRILERLRDSGLPNPCRVLTGDPDSPCLNEALVTIRRVYWECRKNGAPYELIYSIQVLEHVEALGAFMNSCFDALAPGGLCVHLVDLGGHDAFEDPTPPLDFQKYPDWLWRCMYPPYERATRRFLPEYVASAVEAGFRELRVVVVRRTEEAYLRSIRPSLRKAAQSVTDEDLSVVEFFLVCRKP